MLNFTTLSTTELEQLKDRKGFVFLASKGSSDSALKNLCHVLIARKITDSLPEQICRFKENATVLVYGDDFDSPAFYEGAEVAEKMGVCRVLPISEFVEAVKNFEEKEVGS